MAYNVCFADDGSTLQTAKSHSEALAIQTALQRKWKVALVVKVSNG